ncbi:MAG: creatininase family protein [Anaerolineae bacterium]|jgi:creatinine amidohydrolase|nr:creatininase family protein [Anaerolineae bacterium]MDH7474110.1 creatininase family protein [Anaerolineae bacterium]
MDTKYQYAELTWPEMRQAIARQPVVLLPFGTVEDHGPHLPLNTDNIIVEAICLETARRAPDVTLVMPLITYGLDEHHMDFPGTVSVDIDTLIHYVSAVAISVARHGFTHILIVNGHGSNASIADLAARRVVLETGAVCGAMSPNAAIDPTLAEPTFSQMRRSSSGGVAHAGEYETAMMLYLRPDLVQMDKAVREMGQIKLKYFNWDHPEPSILAWQDWWSRMSESGVCGDPTVATAEFGKALFETTVENFVRFVREFRTIPLRPRQDLH